MWDVVVIGAGVAGLTAAQQLHRTGYSVLVVDKSRGLGGRLATRRVNAQPVDHGCRYLSPFQNDSSGLLPNLLATGVLQPWHPSIFELNAAGKIQPRSEADTYYVAPLGMTAVAKAMAAGLSIQRQCRVTQLAFHDSAWGIHWGNAEGCAETTETRAVVAAMPAPQLQAILPQVTPASSSIDDEDTLMEQLASVRFDPVITVMAGYGNEAEQPFTTSAAAFTPMANPGWMVCGHHHASIRWAGLDSSKRQPPASSVVVFHSTPDFACGYLDQNDISEAGRGLIESAAAAMGDWCRRPVWVQPHRWRYGFVKQALADGVVHHAAWPGLVVCGDWCMGTHAEAAFYSGQKAAHTVMQVLT